jgi:hypothetical protein
MLRTRISSTGIRLTVIVVLVNALLLPILALWHTPTALFMIIIITCIPVTFSALCLYSGLEMLARAAFSGLMSIQTVIFALIIPVPEIPPPTMLALLALAPLWCANQLGGMIFGCGTAVGMVIATLSFSTTVPIGKVLPALVLILVQSSIILGTIGMPTMTAKTSDIIEMPYQAEQKRAA